MGKSNWIMMDALNARAKRWLETAVLLAAETAPATLVPEAFFLAASGVVTLAFRGHPVCICRLRKSLNECLNDLDEETRGSGWPKSTLAVRISENPLSRVEVQLIRTLCAKWTRVMRAESTPLPLRELTFILYRCRSLELREVSIPIPLDGTRTPCSEVDEASRRYVQRLLEDSEQDVESVLAPGHDADYYRAPRTEATLVFDWHDWRPSGLDELRADLDRYLRGRYVWFEPSSFHVTVRNLGFVNFVGSRPGIPVVDNSRDIPS